MLVLLTVPDWPAHEDGETWTLEQVAVVIMRKGVPGYDRKLDFLDASRLGTAEDLDQLEQRFARTVVKVREREQKRRRKKS